MKNSEIRSVMSQKLFTEKQVVLLTENHGVSDIFYDAKSLKEVKAILLSALDYVDGLLCEGKLTYSQIVRMVINGQQDRIPKGYHIKYKPHEPGIMYDYDIPSMDIKVTRGKIPIPKHVHVVGEYRIVDYDSYSEEPEKPLEFGDVYLDTKFVLSTFSFFYSPKTKEESDAILEYIRLFGEGISTAWFRNKKEFSVDVELNIGDFVMKCVNAWPQDIIFKGPENDVDEIELKMLPDYYNISDIYD